jgi:hypothetical protein
VAELIYASCALASLFCAGLLVQNYRRTRLRLALYSCLAFGGLALNNVLLFIDLVVVRNIDLSIVRSASALVALAVLVLGLVLEET